MERNKAWLASDKMKFRLKFLLAVAAFILFWFILFYPIIIPWMNETHIYPLLGVIIFEGLFYLMMTMLSFVILGEEHAKHAWRFGFVLFALYHVFDSIEPPFILNSTGAFEMSQSAIISWDYGIAYTLNQLTGLSGPWLFYITNIGFVLLLLIVSVLLISPSTLGKIARRIIK